MFRASLVTVRLSRIAQESLPLIPSMEPEPTDTEMQYDKKPGRKWFW